jgi:hypothetical protein
LRASSVQPSTQVIEAFDVMGEPVRFAHRHRHDLVVVGHDRGAHHPWRRPFGIRLLHDAHLPVVMVPAE